MRDYNPNKSKSNHSMDTSGTPKSRRPRMTPVKALRSKVWIFATYRIYKIGDKEFCHAGMFGSDSEARKTHAQWINGDRLPSVEKKVNVISKTYPTSRFYYDFPVFDLLGKTITKSKLNNLFNEYSIDLLSGQKKSSPSKSDTAGKKYNEAGRILMWDFPDTENNGSFKPIGKCFQNDFDTLFQRGDIFGFIGILMLLRRAELDGDTMLHIELIKAAYRALPGFCRCEHFKAYWKEFYSALESIHLNVMTSVLLVKPLDKVIEAQIFAKTHITRRELQPKCWVDGRFIEPDRPYVDSEFDAGATSNKQDIARLDYISNHHAASRSKVEG